MDWSSFILPIMRHFRIKRAEKIARSYPDLNELAVLDVGGRPMIWELLRDQFGMHPKRLVILNNEAEIDLSEGYQVEVGDGCDLHFQDSSFDLVFSNSVIEHVGSMGDMELFAREIKRVGREVYIQTPNRWFPVEPHLVALFIHWLPRKFYRFFAFLSLRRLSLIRDKERFYEIFDGICLLDRKEVTHLFPDKLLYSEKVFGLVKSFILTDRELK